MQKITILSPFSPVVYVHWSGTKCLYVGHSGLGLRRPFSGDHKIYSYRKDITHTDVYHVKTKEDAVALEKSLTEKLNPKYDESYRAGWGYKKHLLRLKSAPVWYLDDSKIAKHIEHCFPKFKTDLAQSALAARMAKLIHLYYRSGKTNASIAIELKMTLSAVDCAIYKINKAMNRPIKRRGRPKKNTVGLHETSEVHF